MIPQRELPLRPVSAPRDPALPYDVAVIGAGVVGAAIARELAKHDLSIALLDANEDVGMATSKANSAILHTGFDAEPGSTESRLVRRGHELLSAWAPSVGIALEPVGAMVVAWTEEEARALPELAERARANGVDDVRQVQAEEVYRREPNLGPGALAGLVVPREALVCTFSTPIALASEAVLNGAELLLEHEVIGIETTETGHVLRIRGAPDVVARWTVNAAGLHSDVIDRMLGYERFTVRPRRGEFIVFDKLARSALTGIVLPTPSAVGKGVLVTPTVYGNVMIGPTADDVEERDDTASTPAGIARLRASAERILPGLRHEEVVAMYGGVRAATEHRDYRIHIDGARRYACVGGIRSTGLTASMAIGESVVADMQRAGLDARPTAEFRSVRMTSLGEVGPRPYESADLIALDPDYGRIVCHCERVTLAEVKTSLAGPVPARSLDGIRRRTRATMGRCQGFHCAAALHRLLSASGPAPRPGAARVAIGMPVKAGR